MAGRLEGGFLRTFVKEAYRNPNQEAEKRSKCPRPPRSRRSTLLAHSGLTDAHACLAPAGPDTLPGQARVPPPSGSCDSPGAAPDHLPGRARSAADLSPALPASAARISPRPGEFCRPTPLARKRPTKMAPSPPALTSPITGVQVAKPMTPSPPALTSPITGVQVAKPTTSPGWGRAITGRLKQIPMFAQVSSYRKHQARARDRVQQPARADRRRLPPAELTRSGRCGPGLGRPGPARRRAGKKRLHFPACSGLGDRIGLPGMKGIFGGSTPSRARSRQKGPRAAGHHFAIAGVSGRNAGPALPKL